MPEIGSYEAKTHLSRLLERVARGERITITRHGVPVALLIPVDTRRARPTDEVIADLRRFRRGRRRGERTLRSMIEEGRR